MSIKVKILSYPYNQNVKKSTVAARFGNNVEIIEDPEFQMGKANKTPEFLKLNPCGKVPVAITPEGPIFESNAIARYVARKSDKSLLGNNDYEASIVDQWIEFSNTELAHNTNTIMGHTSGYFKISKEKFEENLIGATKAAGYLESALSGRNFLVSDRVTLADIIMVFPLLLLFNYVLGQDEVSKYPNVVKFIQAVISIPQFVPEGESLEIKLNSYVYA